MYDFLAGLGVDSWLGIKPEYFGIGE